VCGYRRICARLPILEAGRFCFPVTGREKRVREKLKQYADDIFYWLGAGLMSAGAYLLSPAAALLVAGAFCLLAAFLIGKGSRVSA